MAISAAASMIGLEEAVQVQLAVVLMVASVLVLAGLAFWLVRDFAAERRLKARMARPWRVAATQIVTLASGRRLVLIRHRDIEHLLLIGGPVDLVVESRVMQAGEHEAGNGGGY